MKQYKSPSLGVLHTIFQFQSWNFSFMEVLHTLDSALWCGSLKHLLWFEALWLWFEELSKLTCLFFLLFMQALSWLWESNLLTRAVGHFKVTKKVVKLDINETEQTLGVWSTSYWRSMDIEANFVAHCLWKFSLFH